jgi:GDSL-like Lipase/Acylhydrolase family
VWIEKTTTLGMRAYGNGQSFRVVVGVGQAAKVTSGKTRRCTCLTDVSLVNNLDMSPHIVKIVNLSSLPLVIQRWTTDQGGVLIRRGAEDTSVNGIVTPGTPLSFYVQKTSLVAIDYLPTGAELDVYLDDRQQGYHLVLPSRQSGGALSRAVVAWGLAAGLEKITIDVVSGSLDLRGIALFQAPGAASPSLVPTDIADVAELLAVYGDAIADGQTSLGFLRDSDGFANRLASLRGWRLSDPSSSSGSASCFGVKNVRNVIATRPNRVIVAFGTNDLLPGPDAQGCAATLKQFGAAMDSILSQLRQGLPGIPIYVQAILPLAKVNDSTLKLWNAELQRVTQANQVAFVDPARSLDTTTDFANPSFPNNGGAQKIANFWNTRLPTS